MVKHLYFDFAIPEPTLRKLDGLLDRVFTKLGISESDADIASNRKFVDELIKTDMTSLTGQMAFNGWLKATGQIADNSYELDYTETGVLIGTLAIILGDIPSPSIKLDEITRDWK